MSLSEQLQGLLAGVDEERVRLEARREQLMLEVHDVDEDLKKLRAIERAVNGGTPGPAKGAPRPRVPDANGNVSQETLDAVRAYMLEHKDERLTGVEVSEATGIHRGTVGKALRELRESGEVILAAQGKQGTLVYVHATGSPPALPAADRTYGPSRSPEPLDALGAQQRVAEERRIQIVQWAREHGKAFHIFNVPGAGEAGDGKTAETQKVGQDLRVLAERGVVRQTGRYVFTDEQLAMKERGEHPGKPPKEWELVPGVPVNVEEISSNGAGHGEPALAA